MGLSVVVMIVATPMVLLALMLGLTVLEDRLLGPFPTRADRLRVLPGPEAERETPGPEADPGAAHAA
jgi:hypothetical protein